MTAMMRMVNSRLPMMMRGPGALAMRKLRGESGRVRHCWRLCSTATPCIGACLSHEWALTPEIPMRPLVLAVLATLTLATAAEQIAVIPKGTTHEFWKSIHAGAIKAQRELNAGGRDIEIIWKGPLKEDDRAEQIKVVENFIGRKVAGIVLAPLDHQALVRPVVSASERKIPVVIIDSAISTDRIASFVATNNFKGGQRGGERLAEVLGGKGKVALLRYQEGSASTMEREAGFLEALKAFPDITIISADQYAGATRDTAFTAAQNLLNRHSKDIDGIFTPNESSTAGMILALNETHLAERIAHVGFDSSAPLIAALKAGTVKGLVVQDPFQMGYLGVMNVAAVIAGKEVPKQIDTPVVLVTPENLDEPAIKDLLNPPLDEYLK